MKDECLLLKLQLKEKDELISQLQEELEKVQHLQKAFASRVDKSTQTELLDCDNTGSWRMWWRTNWSRPRQKQEDKD